MCRADAPADAKHHRPSPRLSLRPPWRPPRSPPRQQPFRWVPLSAAQQRQAEQLLGVFENSSLQPSYGYAQNLRDGRGVTFGRQDEGQSSTFAVLPAHTWHLQAATSGLCCLAPSTVKFECLNSSPIFQ